VGFTVIPLKVTLNYLPDCTPRSAADVDIDKSLGTFFILFVPREIVEYGFDELK